MSNIFSVILEFDETDSIFMDALSTLLNQSLRDIKIIIVPNSKDCKIKELKTILGENAKIKFYEKNNKSAISDVFDSKCVIFCNKYNILKHDALNKLYELYEKYDKEVLIFNKDKFELANKSIFNQNNFNICNFLFSAEFVKNIPLKLNDFFASLIPIFKVFETDSTATVRYNPFAGNNVLGVNKLSDWKKYLQLLDETYTYLTENATDDEYIKNFTDFYLKNINDLLCLKNDKEVKAIKRFLTGRSSLFFKIIKNKDNNFGCDILKKYFAKSPKKLLSEFSEEINIIISCGETDAPFVALTVLSIIEHSCKNILYKIHILYTDLSENAMRNLFDLSTDNVEILFTNIRNYMNDFKVEFKDVEILIPKIFKDFKQVIFLRNNSLLRFDINKFSHENISGNNIIGISDNTEDFSWQNVVAFIFNIENCLKNQIADKLLIFYNSDGEQENYLDNFLSQSRNKYNLTHYNNSHNMDDENLAEWLQYAKNTSIYEWFVYNLVEKEMNND